MNTEEGTRTNARAAGAGASRENSRGRLKVAALAVGVLAGIGGFLDAGGVITAVAAGARFHLALLWTVVFGIIGFSVFAEMSGRIAVASSQPTYEVIRTRLGPRLGAVPLFADLVVHILVLALDLMGMALALNLLTGVSYLVWVPILAAALALALLFVNFSRIDTGAAIAGLTMLVMVAAALKLSPDWPRIGVSLVHPLVSSSFPAPVYLFAVASLLGSFMTPYQFDFYSSGAIEEGWTGRDLKQNRVVAILGTVVGGVLTMAVMIAGSESMFPYAQPVDSIIAAGHPAHVAFGRIGFDVFLVGIFAVSLAASIELCLSGAYGLSQYFGWEWGKSGPPRTAPAFNGTIVAMIAIACAIDLTGVDPTHFTVVTMALGAAALPFTFAPLLLVANDRQFMGNLRNGRLMNFAAGVVLIVVVVVALATLPLLVITGGNF